MTPKNEVRVVMLLERIVALLETGGGRALPPLKRPAAAST